jgi:hypothetical protein
VEDGLSLLAADGDSTYLAFSGVVGQAEAAVIEEAGECRPAGEAVGGGLGGLALAGELGALLAQPGFQFEDEGPAALGAPARALVRCQAIDLALDGEQRIDPLDRLDRDRRLVDAGDVEELAPLTPLR